LTIPISILSDQEEKIAREVLGQIFQADERLDEYIAIAKSIAAGKTFSQGLGLKEKDIEVILGLAANRYTATRYEDAARLYSFASLLNHFDTRALQGAGMALKKLGFFDAALQYFAAYLLQQPENLEVNLMLAECMAMSDRKKEALDLINQITEQKNLEPDSTSKRSITERANALKVILTKKSDSE